MPTPPPSFPMPDQPDLASVIEDFLAGEPAVSQADVEAILANAAASEAIKAQAREALDWAAMSAPLRSEITPPPGARERLLAQLRAADAPTETAAPSAASFFPAGDLFADTLEAFFDGRLTRNEMDHMINDPQAERGFRRDLAETLTLTDTLRRAHARLEPEPAACDRLLDAIAQLAADETDLGSLDDEEDALAPIPFPTTPTTGFDTPDLLAAGLEDDTDDPATTPEHEASSEQDPEDPSVRPTDR
ncbi:MAG: hypothetical protein AAF797_05265 [Planctomycetota bacterium]